MRNLPIDYHSRAIQCSGIGMAKNFTTGVITDPEVVGFVRIKNVGEDNATFRLSDQSLSTGIVLSPSETEYFYIETGRHLEIVSGTLNIMY